MPSPCPALPRRVWGVVHLHPLLEKQAFLLLHDGCEKLNEVCEKLNEATGMEMTVAGICRSLQRLGCSTKNLRPSVIRVVNAD